MASNRENLTRDLGRFRTVNSEIKALADEKKALCAAHGRYSRDWCHSSLSSAPSKLIRHVLTDRDLFHAMIEKHITQYTSITQNFRELGLSLAHNARERNMLEQRVQALKLELDDTEQRLWDSICVPKNSLQDLDKTRNRGTSPAWRPIGYFSSDRSSELSESISALMVSDGDDSSEHVQCIKKGELGTESPGLADFKVDIGLESEPARFRRDPTSMTWQQHPRNRTFLDTATISEGELKSDDRLLALELGYELVNMEDL